MEVTSRSFPDVSLSISSKKRNKLLKIEIQNTIHLISSVNVPVKKIVKLSKLFKDVVTFSQPTDNNFHSLLEFEDKDKTLTPELLSKLSSLFGSKLNVSKSEICIREVINEELKYTKKQIKPKEKKIAQLTSELFNLEQKLASNHQNNSNSIIISKVDNSNNDELFLQNLFYRTVNSFSKSIIQISEQKQTIKTKSVEYFEKWAMIANRRQKERENEQLLKKLLQEEKVARDQLLAQKTYECPICYSDYPIENIYRLDGCYHSYCRDCLQNHFKLKISERQLRKIDCPDPTCKVIITPSQIKHLVSVDDYQKYEAFLLQDALEEIPNLRWCPKRDCGNAMIGDPFSPMMICTNPQCVFSFCFNCKEEWHADATCAQYQQWKIENSEGEARYAEWIRLNAKACPKCKSFIEKNGGCNHMTCRSCAHEFCWLCFEDYNASHFSNGKCKQFS